MFMHVVIAATTNVHHRAIPFKLPSPGIYFFDDSLLFRTVWRAAITHCDFSNRPALYASSRESGPDPTSSSETVFPASRRKPVPPPSRCIGDTSRMHLFLPETIFTTRAPFSIYDPLELPYTLLYSRYVLGQIQIAGVECNIRTKFL